MQFTWFLYSENRVLHAFDHTPATFSHPIYVLTREYFVRVGMKTLIITLFMLCTLGTAASAQSTFSLSDYVVREPGLEFVTETRIPGFDDEMMSLCYVTDDLVVFGVALTSDVQSYALASDGCETEYEKRHDEIWPELVGELIKAGIEDYSIFLHPETLQLFAVLWRKPDHTMDDLPLTQVMQQWWEYMGDIMQSNPDNSPVVTPLTKVFHLA